MTIWRTRASVKRQLKAERERLSENFGLIFGSKYIRCDKCWDDITPGMESEVPGVCHTCCAVLDIPRLFEYEPEVKE